MVAKNTAVNEAASLFRVHRLRLCRTVHLLPGHLAIVGHADCQRTLFIEESQLQLIGLSLIHFDIHLNARIQSNDSSAAHTYNRLPVISSTETLFIKTIEDLTDATVSGVGHRRLPNLLQENLVLRPLKHFSGNLNIKGILHREIKEPACMME